MGQLFVQIFLWIALLSFPNDPFFERPAYADSGDISPYSPVYHIPLRVHLGESGRPVCKWIPILEEINQIWWLQAGICFEMEIVDHNDIVPEGMDIWFSADESSAYNGVFRDEHDIWVKDAPMLRPASRSATYPAARTAAHELGHGLGLIHSEGTDDNLMRSQTFGWYLGEDEIVRARRHAVNISIADTTARQCGSLINRKQY